MDKSDNPDRQTILRVAGIAKAFPGVRAIESADFELHAGEVHALVGENGAGKSTLIKVLSGVHPADSGEIILNGAPAEFSSPSEAREAGIATIYQEFTLVPALSVAANLFLGRERKKRGLIDRGFERAAAREIFDRVGVGIDPDAIVSGLTVAQQQIVEISRALLADAQILVMDEPTAALTPREVERLFTILAELKARGIGIIFVSHRLDEVFRIADRITVMRDGRTIITSDATSMTRPRLIEHMVGRRLNQEFPKKAQAIGEARFEISDLSGGPVRNISLTVRRGEVLGITGLMGAGRTELARLIFGADRKESGEVVLNGRTLRINSPRDAIRNGICLLTEDRKGQGLVLIASAMENFALPNLGRWSRFGVIDRGRESSRFMERVKSLNIRITGPGQKAQNLSGGNQQKLLVARWLETNSQVVIFDEPTRGIDVGAKHEMYLLINDLAAQGKAIIMISSELPEIMGICDRILVMRAGRISGEITDMACASQERIMSLAV